MAGAGRRPARRDPYQAQVIVMRPDHHGLLAQARIPSSQDAHDVASPAASPALSFGNVPQERRAR